MKYDARDLALPEEWTKVMVPEIDTEMLDGTQVFVTQHEIEVANRYPALKDGSLVANVTQVQAMEFLKAYNEAFGLKEGKRLRTIFLFEDEAVRDQLGPGHKTFDENFNREGMPYRWGYVGDSTRPYDEGAKGIGQQLITRMLYWRLPDRELEIGPIALAPSGMAPKIDSKEMEKIIGKEGLLKLANLTGRKITDGPIDVRNALGYPQYSLDHEYKDGEKLLLHSHHVYSPSQNAGETVGVRGAGWDRHGGVGCFSVGLDFDPSCSGPGRSFPLVRGGPVEARIKRPSYSFRLY